MDQQRAMEEFEQAAYQSGGVCRERIMASARLAIAADPDNWPSVLASLQKWRPEFFSQEAAIRRQGKASVTRGILPHPSAAGFLRLMRILL